MRYKFALQQAMSFLLLQVCADPGNNKILFTVVWAFASLSIFAEVEIVRKAFNDPLLLGTKGFASHECWSNITIK